MVMEPLSTNHPELGAGVFTTPLPTPAELQAQLPLPESLRGKIQEHRRIIQNIINGTDQRLLAVIGPCSIHDLDAGLQYAGRLRPLAEKYQEKLVIVMRTYMEKPRTSHFWKGLVNDPYLNGTNDLRAGLTKAREFLLQVNHMGLACATEFLNPIVPMYLGDLISWAAIGARTTTSQTHREMASWLPMPVGFKNSLDGDVQVAVDSLHAAGKSHTIFGVNDQGKVTAMHTPGNPYVHLTLRGGRDLPNYNPEVIEHVKKCLHGLPHKRLIMVDCSHGNSNKHHKNQVEVLNNLIAQVKNGETAILGFMLESFLEEGNQILVPGQPLRYGVSITDSCVSWADTEYLLEKTFDAL